MIRQALWATPCCGRVLYLVLGPRAELPRKWHRLECYCGKRYDFEATTLASFSPVDIELPNALHDDDHWWQYPSQLIVAREPCDAEGCDEPCYIACRIFGPAGPADVRFCKTHVQRVGILVDTLVQSNIFSPTAAP